MLLFLQQWKSTLGKLRKIFSTCWLPNQLASFFVRISWEESLFVCGREFVPRIQSDSWQHWLKKCQLGTSN